jgi:type VI secretion system secreted protein VgrG
MAELQAERAVEIFTPLGDDVLLFHRMTATEALGHLFQYDLDLLSKDPNIKFEDLLGQSVTVSLELPQDKTRYFNGFVSRFSLSGSLGDLSAYTATVRPWLWFLTRTADCRIFQEMTVPDIIKQVFRDQGFTDFEEALSGSYRKWTYCVQYRETDFNFVSRLMEQEGIYYYFKHEKNKHQLVLADSVSSHEAFPGYEKLPFFPPDEHLRREEHHIYEWTVSQEVQPGIYALDDYDFERPKASLQVKATIQRGHARARMEIFDYPGEYTQTGDGETYVRARIEELQAEYEQVQGQSNARGLSVGSLFQLIDYPRQDQNREYLVVSATHELESDAYTSGSAAEGEDVYACSFTALDSKQPYRQPRTTPKPMVQGPQTAIVVGPSGEEIYTDKYGRVKIQFHWDRYGKNDENSSCWVRVAHVWAGTKWGGIQLPRIGQEVIVEFLEGDPDRPLITGRVYNNDNMPPYDLPANATQSGIKSRSSKGGSADNFNEIRFEDKKGAELVYIHAEKDESIVVENDKDQSVGHDESLSVGNDRRKSVEKNQSESIGENKSISVGKNHSESIGENATIDVGKNESVSVGENLTLSVGKNSSETIGEKLSRSVGKDMSSDIGNNLSQNVAKKSTTQVGDDMALGIGKKLNVQAADQINIFSDKQILLKSGSASITLKKNGDITIKGKKINIKGSGDVTIKGSKIKEN